MKITKTQLKKLIREEVGLLQEGLSPLSDPANPVGSALRLLNNITRTGGEREAAIMLMAKVFEGLGGSTAMESFKAAVEEQEAEWKRRREGSSWIRKT
jgi:hypothetical protein